MSADERIVEALDERWPSFPFERFKDTDGIPCLASVYAREVAEAIEPIIRAREKRAWYEGENAGLGNYEQDDLGDFISNPYRGTP